MAILNCAAQSHAVARSASRGEVSQASVHRLDLRFEIGHGLSEVPRGCAGRASMLALELAQRGDREQRAPYSTLETIALERGAESVG